MHPQLVYVPVFNGDCDYNQILGVFYSRSIANATLIAHATGYMFENDIKGELGWKNHTLIHSYNHDLQCPHTWGVVEEHALGRKTYMLRKNVE